MKLAEVAKFAAGVLSIEVESWVELRAGGGGIVDTKDQ